MPHAVLVIDDNEESLDLISGSLQDVGYRVVEADSARLGILIARKERPDLIVLSLVNSEMDGLAICKQLKRNARTAVIPILVMTLPDPEGHEVSYLKLKKFGPLEFIRDVHLPPDPCELLLARCRAFLPDVLHVADMMLDEKAKLVRRGKQVCDSLTPQEFCVLLELAKRSPRPVSALTLYRLVCRREPPEQEHFKKKQQAVISLPDLTHVELLVRNIRKKLKLKRGEWLATVRGRGYKLVPPTRADRVS